MSVSLILKNVCQQSGEAPHWDEEKQLLYFVDIQLGDVHMYNPATEEHRKIHIGKSTSLLLLQSTSMDPDKASKERLEDLKMDFRAVICTDYFFNTGLNSYYYESEVDINFLYLHGLTHCLLAL